MPGQEQVIDFARSYCYYIPVGHTIWVRIQAECRCEVFDRSTGASDEYVLGVRTQTGLRTVPVSDALDPGYDFWMTFSKKHIFVKRNHTSAHTNNPTRVPVSEFVESGRTFRHQPARQLHNAAEVLDALKNGLLIVGRTEFSSSDGAHGYRIEYPVKWADGDPVKDNFRVETGPVLLLDPNKARVGDVPEFDDFRWSYLDYHNFDEVRCILERRTPILTGVTYRGSTEGPRGNSPITADDVDKIRERLFGEWDSPAPVEELERIFSTNHYSEISHKSVTTQLYAIDEA